MFNQEQPEGYVPRRYLVVGNMCMYPQMIYEIVCKGRVVDWHTNYAFALAMCDELEGTTAEQF